MNRAPRASHGAQAQGNLCGTPPTCLPLALQLAIPQLPAQASILQATLYSRSCLRAQRMHAVRWSEGLSRRSGGGQVCVATARHVTSPRMSCMHCEISGPSGSAARCHTTTSAACPCRLPGGRWGQWHTAATASWSPPRQWPQVNPCHISPQNPVFLIAALLVPTSFGSVVSELYCRTRTYLNAEMCSTAQHSREVHSRHPLVA